MFLLSSYILCDTLVYHLGALGTISNPVTSNQYVRNSEIVSIIHSVLLIYITVYFILK